MEDIKPANDAAVADSSSLGFGEKLINVFTSPTKTFEALNSRPTWLAPLLIIMLLTIITTQIMFPIIMDAQLERIKSSPNISQEQLEAIESQFADNVKTQRIITAVSQLIVTPLGYLLLSGIFYLVGTVFLGGDTTFKKVLSVFSWSTCILILSTIITVPLVIVKGNMDISLSLALLLPADAIGTKLYTLLSKFDFFTIWFLAVFAIGFRTIYRFSTAKAYTAVGILWGIWVAVSVLLSGVFSQFGI